MCDTPRREVLGQLFPLFNVEDVILHLLLLLLHLLLTPVRLISNKVNVCLSEEILLYTADAVRVLLKVELSEPGCEEHMEMWGLALSDDEPVARQEYWGAVRG